MSRANLSEEALKRIPNTYLYVDEFQNFANESFAEILSESRKYKLCLTVANQYVDQMTEEVRNAVIGNVGTFISFRVGSTDAELMEKEFAPNFMAEDMVNLGFTQMYLKLMIDGIGSRPFSANSLPPIPKPEQSYVEEIIALSRKQFSAEREKVEAEIKKWTNRDFNLELQKAAAQQAKPKVKKEEKKEDKPKPVLPSEPTLLPPEFSIEAKPLDSAKEDLARLEIQKILSSIEKADKAPKPVIKKENPRRKVFLDLQREHAFSYNRQNKPSKQTANQKPKQATPVQVPKPVKQVEADLDEVPEDVLKALLDMSDL
jgi:hypothetical protein